MGQRFTSLKRGLKVASLGAVAMYLLDPDRGQRRRDWVREKTVRTKHVTETFMGKAWRDSRNRAAGLAAATRSLVSGNGADDTVLRDRVRAVMGRWVRHPHAIMVLVREGRVILEGPVLADEVADLLKAVRRVRGVREVENRLEAHEGPDQVPSLQGEAPVPVGHRRGYLGRSWPPAVRLAVGAAGGLLAAWGAARRRSVTGAAAMAAGLAGLTRAMTNRELTRVLGIQAGRRAAEFHRTWHVDAPVDQVFAFLSEFQNLAKNTNLVTDVQDLGEGKSRWHATGPGGLPLEWTATVTKFVPNQSIGWRTEPDSPLQHVGEIRFQEQDGGTAVHLWFAYNPVVGLIGHGLGTVLGADAESLIEQAIGQLKQALEIRFGGSFLISR